MPEEDTLAPIWNHLLELRQTFIACFICFVIAMAGSLYFYQEIFTVITKPLQTSFPQSALLHQKLQRERMTNQTLLTTTYSLPPSSSVSSKSAKVQQVDHHMFVIPPGEYLELDTPLTPATSLAIFGPVDGISTVFKACFWFSLIISSPFLFFLIFRFVAPGLHKHEKRLSVYFFALSILFLMAGFASAYFITIPLANRYLQMFNGNLGTNLWSLPLYFDYTFFLMLANGFAFEGGLVLLTLVHLRILNLETLISKRRHMIVLAFILGAVLTPPDVLTQILLAGSFIILYEFTILYAKIR